MGWWYCFTIFIESASSDAYENEYTVSSFGSLGMSLGPGQSVYWGQTVWSIMFLLSIPQNMLGLGQKNWRGCRSEDQ